MTTYAAIDIGSNTTGLLITDAHGNEIERVMTPTRLGRAVDVTRRFHPDAVDRTLECLGRYRSILDRHDIDRIRSVATSASRRAEDFPEFSDSARSVLDRDIELIDGLEEGRLAHIGAVSRLVRQGGPLSSDSHLVIDVGGGSTEMSAGTDRPQVVRSLEVGVVRLTEKHLRSDPPRPEELVNAIAEVQDLVADSVREAPLLARATTAVGCSGTMIAIAAVEIGSSEVPNGFVLSRSAAEDVFRTLATETSEDRIHNPGLDAHRVDIIVAGCCILVGILRTLEIDSITISLGNILDGICIDLGAQP